MLLRATISVLLLFITCIALGQAVTIRINLQGQDSTGKPRFRIWIKNNAYSKYYVQDTLRLQQYTGDPALSYVVPEFEKKEQDGEYHFVNDAMDRTGVAVPDQCMRNCCTCTILKKGEEIRFDLDMLDCCTLKKGDYRVKAFLHPLMIPEEAQKKKEKVMSESNYIYFSIK